MRLYIILCLGLLFWGCEGGSVLGPEAMRVRFPETSTTFIYEGYEIDRFNNRVSGTTTEFSSVVLSNDTIMFGKSDVFVMRTQYPDTSFMEYFAIDDENDLLRRVTLGSSSIWMSIPITTLAETNDTIKATIDLSPGKRGTMEYMYKHTYYGDESFTIDTLKLSGRKFRSTQKYQIVSAGQITYEGIDENIDHYIPSLGVLGHSMKQAQIDQRTGTWMNGYVIRLKRYFKE
ncbi:MAG: hypothetical protein ACO34C_00005 [Candidatus Kapaibacteriota bacterium]